MATISTGLRQMLLGSQGLKDIFLNGTIMIYSGNQPTSADDAVTGSLIAQITLNGGAFIAGSATNGINFDAPVLGVLSKAAAESWKLKGLLSGVMGYFRLVGNAADNGLSSTTLPRIDGSVGINSGDLKVSSLSPLVGSYSSVDTFTVTFG